MSLFQPTADSLGLDNPQSREEDEELEEQKRREEELADLLATGINAFNYDETTLNSSITSAEGIEPNFQETIQSRNELKYKDSGKTSLGDLSTNLSDGIYRGYKDVDQQEQLKVLYDVRVREINKLRNEFDKFREDKSREIHILKNKATLAEAEVRHLQVTLSNSESLLVEKNDIIKDLKQGIATRDEEMQNLHKVLEEQNLEICTYKSTVNELQLKLADNNPFSTGTRKLNSEELQRAHQDQVIKLETLLQEQSKKVQILEKEKGKLQEDIKKILGQKNQVDEENNLTIVGLSKKLQSTQQQCKDLFELGEAIKKESDHFKERMHQFETNQLNLSGSFQNKSMDKDTMMVYLEKLKRMLLDKDVELNTLKAKLKFYNSDLEELFEYRQILSKMYSSEVQQCNNVEHEELIIFMQRQLQSYEQAIEDRNNQIMNLNAINKELQEKIEEMIQQTRTDIQNISQKYSLPQLETMSNELKNAEETINILKEKLLEKDDLIKSLELSSDEKNQFQEVVLKVKQELKERDEEKTNLLNELKGFKKAESQLTDENERVKTQLQKVCLKLGLSEAEIFESDNDVHELSSLKTKFGQIHDQLQQVLIHLENTNIKRTNFNIIFKLKKQIQNYLVLLNEQNLEQVHFQDKLEQWDNMLSDFIESLKHTNDERQDNIDDLCNAKTMLEGEKFALEYQLKSRTLELEESKKEIALLKESNIAFKNESEMNSREVQKLNDEINNLKKWLKSVEENKAKVENQLEVIEQQLKEAKKEKREVKDVENGLEKSSEISGSDLFQAQVLKAEISLRDRLQEENIKKMQKIEERYKHVISEKLEVFNKEKEQWKQQEANYRKQFASVLEECGKKMERLEKENLDLIKRINVLCQEYKTFKNSAISNVEKYNKIIVDCRKTMEDSNNKWSALLQRYMVSTAKIEKQHHKTAKSVLKKISLNQTEVKLIENLYDEKIRKIKAERNKIKPDE